MNESWLCRLRVRKRLCNPLTRPASRDTLSPKGARVVVLIPCCEVGAVHRQLRHGRRRGQRKGLEPGDLSGHHAQASPVCCRLGLLGPAGSTQLAGATESGLGGLTHTRDAHLKVCASPVSRADLKVRASRDSPGTWPYAPTFRARSTLRSPAAHDSPRGSDRAAEPPLPLCPAAA